jgi:YidC/Oxa1 family membrane protein insertase
MFDGFLEFVASVMAWFYSLVPSYGFAIGMLTITVMLIITPLTLKSTRSMIQMQRLQPELKKLQEKYKGDREKLNTELMAFYKANDLNPLSGCIPVVAQLPVFILLYNVLRGLTIRYGGNGSGIGHVTGQIRTGESFTPWQLHDQPFDPAYLNPSSEMWRALHNSTKMNFLGMDLSISPWDALKIGLLFAIPYLVLMLLLLGSQIIQNRQIQGRTRNQPNNMPSQQQAIMKFLPFLLPIFSIQFPAGLGYYYFVQGLCRIGTQAYITRKFYDEGATAPVVIDTTSVDSSAKEGSAKGSSNGKATPAQKGSSNGAAKKPGSSPKSQALQKKATGGSKSSGGRKSGTPRSGGGRPSGTS